MKTFTKISKSVTLKNDKASVEIYKFVKDGTKRLTSTMFSTLNECRTATRNYLATV